MSSPVLPPSSLFPFSAVVGMEELRLALLLNAVSPAIGGVLVRGEKGTAKSTVVRALAGLLPPVDVVTGCRFACAPHQPDPLCPDGPHERAAGMEQRPARLVELPIGATEDRVIGSLELERALSEGVKAYEPGLLAAAHRGVLYVDEVNLLHDSLVDLLLDAAAMGRAHVEREGISVSHAARFLLVGTMNPEEGELRPQLLDRFGLTVEVRASREPSERAEVVRRRLSYDDDPAAFAASWREAEATLGERIAAARGVLPDVRLGDAALRSITSACAAFEVDGMRADLVMARTALALAAWEGRTDVSGEDVRRAALLALPHRRRRNPFDAPGLDEDRLDEALQSAGGDDEPPPEPPDGGGGGRTPETAEAPQQERGQAEPPSPDETSDESRGGARDMTDTSEPSDPPQAADSSDASAEASGERPQSAAPSAPAAAPADPYRVRRLEVPGMGAGVAGRRSRASTPDGRTTGSRLRTGGETVRRLHLAATIRAAAPEQARRGRTGPGLVVRPEDLRLATREGREGNVVLFAVDASGSMAARSRMTAVKGAVLSLLLDAYQRRDKVGLITFRGAEADLALPPTSSVDIAAARLTELPTGGRTPLAAAMLRAAEVLRLERLRDARRRPLLVVVTDGRHTSGPDPLSVLAPLAGVATVVVDCESGPVRLGLAGRLAEAMQGELIQLEHLGADALVGVVRDTRSAA